MCTAVGPACVVESADAQRRPLWIELPRADELVKVTDVEELGSGFWFWFRSACDHVTPECHAKHIFLGQSERDGDLSTISTINPSLTCACFSIQYMSRKDIHKECNGSKN